MIKKGNPKSLCSIQRCRFLHFTDEYCKAMLRAAGVGPKILGGFRLLQPGSAALLASFHASFFQHGGLPKSLDYCVKVMLISEIICALLVPVV
jgi:hypothetical protein